MAEGRRRCLAALGLLAWPGLGTAQPTQVPLALSSVDKQGADLALLALLGDAAGLEWQIKVVPKLRSILMAEQGEALTFGLSPSAERLRRLLFSDAVMENQVWLLAHKRNPLLVNALPDLAGQRFCMRRGVSYGDAFDAARDRLFPVTYSDGNFESRLRMVVAGRCDVTAISQRGSQLRALQRRLEAVPELHAQLRILPKPLLTETIHFAVGHGQALARHMPALNQAIRVHKAELRRLVERDD